ncbi:MAG TPA: serine/threonine-protein kinase [Vicinamibacterales bacterium]|nr:serine/threonine-protein kinase [Vicinamibacterales bacterium]
MPACPSCAAEIPDSAAFCPRCSAPTPWSSDDVTHLRTAPAAGRKTGSTTSWLTSTDAIDHGRFQPGAIFDDRYRIIGRLGKGGMGEVYRADDLKLGQPVALKFLPPDVDTDPARLTQLHTEVRMARQVSHPNVCRVYDVGEVEGHTFLSMEYVDGEDLASLIRRVGRFPQDRGVELARQICAGLAAAHDRGVVHRDLKPANIMLDGGGRIRITDFGLAGAAGETMRSGTPAYMAPEQLAGGEVTPRSDIYALGLVLYELFTGRRALEGRSLAELIAKREQDGISAPSTVIRDLDPAIDRAIMRCIESDPAQRPASALAVAAALPGGDPLAAALAAGETPSPEMVAAAGTTSALRPAGAFLGLGVTLAAIAAWAVLSDRLLVTSVVPLPKPPILLAERAKEILVSLGHSPGIDSASGLMPANFLGYGRQRPDLATRERLASGTPGALHFWYRGSPTVMVPPENEPRVTTDQPLFNISGMSLVVTDAEGRLQRLSVIPPQVDPPSPKTGFGGTGPLSPKNGFGETGPPSPKNGFGGTGPLSAQNGVADDTNWKALFDAAGLDFAAYTRVEPEWTPPLYADVRVAWTGPVPNVPGETLRVEAAAYRGKAVYFHQVARWTTPTRMPATIAERTRVRWSSALVQVVVLAMFLAAGLIARHNLRKGRGDRRGAFLLAATISLAAVGVWVLDSKHVPDPGIEMSRFFVGQPLWAAGLLWLIYLALEPYVRRFWPTTLVSWSRLMAGQWRDPLVGRDILFGAALGAVMTVIGYSSDYLNLALGYPTPPVLPELRQLLGTHVVIARQLNQVFNALLNALFAVYGMVLLKMFVKRERVAVAVAILLSFLLAVRGIFDGGSAIVNGAAGFLLIAIIVLTIDRLGLVATVTLFLVNMMMNTAVVTLDSSRWFFGNSLLLIAMPAAVACYGFYVSRGGEPLLGRRVLD